MTPMIRAEVEMTRFSSSRISLPFERIHLAVAALDNECVFLKRSRIFISFIFQSLWDLSEDRIAFSLTVRQVSYKVLYHQSFGEIFEATGRSQREELFLIHRMRDMMNKRLPFKCIIPSVSCTKLPRGDIYLEEPRFLCVKVPQLLI